VLVENPRNPNPAFVGEEGQEHLHVLGLMPKIHLLPDPNGKLSHQVRQGSDVMVSEEDIEPEEDPEGNLQIQGHGGFHPWPEHLDRYVFPFESSLIDLPQAGSRHGFSLEILKNLVHRTTQLIFQDLRD
jgi:hypothetical protein